MEKLAKHLYSNLKKKRSASKNKPQQLFHLLPNGFTLLDIGAAGGIEPRWEKVCESLNYIGIEPDKRECKRVKSIKQSAK